MMRIVMCILVLLPLVHAAAGVTTCATGRANVLHFGADPSGKNDSAPAFRAAIAACQSVYAPAGNYLLRTAEPSGRLPPSAALASSSSIGAASGTCPSDGRNCLHENCTCPPGDGPPYDMAAYTKNPWCMACHPFMPPPSGFLDWSSLEVGGKRGGGGLVGDGQAVTVILVEYLSNQHDRLS
jgi:hypothetical protein